MSFGMWLVERHQQQESVRKALIEAIDTNNVGAITYEIKRLGKIPHSLYAHIHQNKIDNDASRLCKALIEKELSNGSCKQINAILLNDTDAFAADVENGGLSLSARNFIENSDCDNPTADLCRQQMRLDDEKEYERLKQKIYNPSKLDAVAHVIIPGLEDSRISRLNKLNLKLVKPALPKLSNGITYKIGDICFKASVGCIIATGVVGLGFNQLSRVAVTVDNGTLNVLDTRFPGTSVKYFQLPLTPIVKNALEAHGRYAFSQDMFGQSYTLKDTNVTAPFSLIKLARGGFTVGWPDALKGATYEKLLDDASQDGWSKITLDNAANLAKNSLELRYPTSANTSTIPVVNNSGIDMNKFNDATRKMEGNRITAALVIITPLGAGLSLAVVGRRRQRD